jgi:hypothetical protein
MGCKRGMIYEQSSVINIFLVQVTRNSGDWLLVYGCYFQEVYVFVLSFTKLYDNY